MKSFVFPGNIEPDILAIASKQVPYMRTQWFSDLVLESESMLLDLIDCPKGRVIPYTASGTAAMEACVSEFVSKCRKTLVINGGTFGARWANLCRHYNISHDEFMVEFGKTPDWSLLERQIETGKYDVLLMQHHETSSGYLYDLEKISEICSKNGLFLVVDAISSFLTDYFSMNSFGVDIAIISSQKGLNLPPGLSYTILAERVLAKAPFKNGTFYLDWDEHLSNLSRGQTPYSPATHLFMQAHERLCRIKKTGIGAVIAAVNEKASVFRDKCTEQGVRFSAECMSNCMTGIFLPFSARPFVDYLLQKNIYILPCGRSNMIRVAHLGTTTVKDHKDLAEEIDKWGK